MNKISNVVKVGIADLNVIAEPNTIRTSGLGSCVGVVIYDELKKIAGLSHVLLPDSSLTKQTNYNEYKYADTAIPILIDKLVIKGARRYALKAKIAGGAQMFKLSTESDMMRIGSRNIEAVKLALKKQNVPIIASDVGGNVGRTIEFDPRTCMLKIRKVNQEEFYI